MAKRKEAKQEMSNGKLLLYLLLVIVAIFMVSRLDITGMVSKVDISLTPTVNAGDSIVMNVDTGGNKIEPEFDIYKHYNGKAIRFSQGYGSVCRKSSCFGDYQIKINTLDSWKTGKYSIRVYDYRKSNDDYTEVFFDVTGIYPGTDEIDEPAVHV